MTAKQVTIIGAGVMGLSCGVRLLEAGWQVQIMARELPQETVSAVAAAIWYPYKAYPEDKVLAWGEVGYREFTRLAQSEPRAGVRLLPVQEFLPEPSPDPWWHTAVDDFHHLHPASLPPGYQDGYGFTAPVIDMSIYLAYLQNWYEQLGGQLTQQTVQNLADWQQGQPLINCTGLGAGELVGDTAVFPIRGQIVLVQTPTPLPSALMDDHGHYRICYIIPRVHDVVLGGVAEAGNWDTAVDETTAADIIRKAQSLQPALADMQIIRHKVGLRPGRPTIRLEREETAAGVIIHNYGHGGAGVSLSWGCATAVVDLLTP
jgi:D-amino-acid oxidase